MQWKNPLEIILLNWPCETSTMCVYWYSNFRLLDSLPFLYFHSYSLLDAQAQFFSISRVSAMPNVKFFHYENLCTRRPENLLQSQTYFSIYLGKSLFYAWTIFDRLIRHKRQYLCKNEIHASLLRKQHFLWFVCGLHEVHDSFTKVFLGIWCYSFKTFKIIKK